MLYLEELLDAVIAEEGETLMGLDFLLEALDLPMSKIELLFKKAVAEYSERRPMKKTEMFSNLTSDSNGEYGFIQMPEGTTSCRVARYGVLNMFPRFIMPKLGYGMSDMYVEFDPNTLLCRVYPPIAPIKLTYTQRYVPTTSILQEKVYQIPYSTSSFSTTLPTAYGAQTLTIQKAVIVSGVATTLTMTPTGEITEEEEYGEITRLAELEGTLGTGTYNLKTREVILDMDNTDIAPLLFTYYPKYSVVKELDLGNFLFTKIFACKLLTALASLRAQATQPKLHGISLETDQLYDRAQDLRKEIHDELKSSISFGALADM